MSFADKFDFKSDELFRNFSETELQLVNSLKEKIHFAKGDKIFYEDGVPTGMFQIIEGRVKKFKKVLDNQQQIFYVYSKNDLFGYHALLSNERYQDSCEAVDDVVVNFISKDNFKLLLSKVPSFKDALLENISHEFGVLANTIAVLAQKSQTVRLALFLLILQKRFAKKDLANLGVDLTREDLANIIGTSRESLSRSLNTLKSKKLITVDKRKITVLNEDDIQNYISK